MFRKVLFPTDFSDCSYKALECVRQMRGAGVEEVVIVSVLDERDTDLVTTGIGWLSGDRMVEYDAGIERRMRENVQERLDGMAGVLREAGMKVRTAIEKGVPSVEILAIAKRERASLIVMGSHGKSNLAGVVVGSVSEEVLRRSSVPVLIITREMQGGCRSEGEE
ncbi:UspA domain-containing protein [Methanofollis liminatans DSM 4140]|uniref:UspA domain-containing protein n=1 Tax=Methanofollis liminatans DSM 4140 TaxID=28892 RepID=J1L2A6_9EURY|nr:UspA domain-containing protein [Methanofollis liminatans DSM 4140]